MNVSLCPLLDPPPDLDEGEVVGLLLALLLLVGRVDVHPADLWIESGHNWSQLVTVDIFHVTVSSVKFSDLEDLGLVLLRPLQVPGPSHPHQLLLLPQPRLRH